MYASLLAVALALTTPSELTLNIDAPPGVTVEVMVGSVQWVGKTMEVPMYRGLDVIIGWYDDEGWHCAEATLTCSGSKSSLNISVISAQITY